MKNVLRPGTSGLAAGAVTLGIAELVAGVIAPASSPLLVVGSAFIDLTPSWLKDFAIATFGTNDKIVLLVSMVFVIGALSFTAGVVAYRHLKVGFGMVGLLALTAVIAAVTRANATTFAALPAVVGAVVGCYVLYRLLKIVSRGRIQAQQESAPDIESPDFMVDKKKLSKQGIPRREFFRGVTIAGGIAGVTGTSGYFIGQASRNVSDSRNALQLPTAATTAPRLPQGLEVDVDGVTSWLTPNADFYRIDTALSVPRVSPEEWTLRIHGMVEEEVEINFSDLLEAELEEQYITLTCVSNPVGGDLAGNAKWLGFPIHKLLAQAKPFKDANMVLSTSVDGFSASTPLESLENTDVRALLAIGMNDEPLPLEHGYPVRMVVPGLYGFVSATKWVVDLEVTRYDEKTAYWTDRGWAEKAPIKVMSRVESPAPFTRFQPNTPVAIGGTAWAQTRGIAKVEVQIDGGDWVEADLGTQANKNTWRQWSYMWEGGETGVHQVRVRATDEDGTTQTQERVDPIPDGASGWHSITMAVE